MCSAFSCDRGVQDGQTRQTPEWHRKVGAMEPQAKSNGFRAKKVGHPSGLAGAMWDTDTEIKAEAEAESDVAIEMGRTHHCSVALCCRWIWEESRSGGSC
jgi:hypothetical protein